MNGHIEPTFLSFSDENVTVNACSIIGKRRTQEDEKLCFNAGIEGHYIYAVFDGHAGVKTVKYIKKNFEKKFLKHPMWVAYINSNDRENFDFTSMFTSFFTTFDTEMKDSIIKTRTRYENSGATAVVVLQTPTKYICANLGDSEAWILMEDDVKKLTTLHRPDDKDETKRVVAAGGYVSNGRVDGSLAVSRAFGDYDFKIRIIDDVDDSTCDPELMQVTAVPSVSVTDRQLYNGRLFIGCDGFFDIMNDTPRSPTHIQSLISGLLDNMQTITRTERILLSLQESQDKAERWAEQGEDEENEEEEEEEGDFYRTGAAEYFLKKGVCDTFIETSNPFLIDLIGSNFPEFPDIAAVEQSAEQSAEQSKSECNDNVECSSAFGEGNEASECNECKWQFVVRQLCNYAVKEKSFDNVTVMIVNNV